MAHLILLILVIHGKAAAHSNPFSKKKAKAKCPSLVDIWTQDHLVPYIRVYSYISGAKCYLDNLSWELEFFNNFVDYHVV